MSIVEHLLINAKTIDATGHQLDQQAIAINKGLIVWCGNVNELPNHYVENSSVIEDCQNQLITPGLIDCHTHLVYAGNRAHEFKLRLEGANYAEIARMGGGILSTVEQTRLASEQELLTQSLPRVFALMQEGVTTVEIKSGYGLDLESELKMLRVARKLASHSGIRVVTTFLGAHAVPLEFKQDSQAYVDFICTKVLPAAVEEGLVDAVDVFCESIGFSLAQTEQLFLKASELNLSIKCHAEQLSNLGASELAAKFGALSCDHLEHLDAKGALAMAKNGTIAVLLPGAYYFLGEKIKPPIALLRELGVEMAIATDANPGSSPTTSLLLMLNMACQLFGLTINEALAGVTSRAAKALGLQDELGMIKVGLVADLVHWSVKENTELCYHFGYPLQHRTMIAGKWLNSPNLESCKQ